jgi:hypothetical protein
MPPLTDFLNSTAGLATKGMLVAAFLDFAFGVFAAGRDGSFSLDALAAFVKKHLLGRVLPIGTLLFVGYLSNDTAMSAAGGVAAAAYTLETLGSIYGSIKPPAESAAKVEAAEAAGNPIPTD